MIKLLLVDDHKMFLEGLRSMLAKEESYDITLASNAAEVMNAFEQALYDVVIMDIEMPESTLSGVELTKYLVEKYEGVKVLVVSVNKTAVAVEQLIKAGAKGYVIKDSGYKELKRAIEELIKGNEHWDPKILQLLIDARRSETLAGEKEGSAVMSQVQLTSREKDVLELLAQGMSSKLIADKLCIGSSTVDTHRKNLIAKFGASNSTEVVHKAKEQGLL